VNQHTDDLYPLRFREIPRDYGFGDRWIVDAFAKEGLPENHRIAETWEVCDRPGESSRVINGPLQGRSLHELIEEHGEQLLGREIVARSGTRFPLLIKFLDASNPLGEQVHQDDALARKQALGDPGKTEAWVMLRAREGATIHCGNRSGTNREQVLQALIDGTSTLKHNRHEERLRPGMSCLLPADLGSVTVEPEGEVSLLMTYVPGLVWQIIDPLRAVGVPDAAIAALGGKTTLNPLPALLKSTPSNPSQKETT
jgi:mannose-6-phosphate isomerase class I